MMLRRWFVLALVFLLAACVGAATTAPGPSARAVGDARRELAGVELQETARSTATNRAMTERAWRRVKPAVDAMCAHFDAEGCAYDLVWSDDETPNAYADGEKVYMFDGLVRYLENEAQVALVLAHEAAHNVAEHPAKGSRNTALGMFAGAVVGGVLGAVIDDSLATEGVALGAAVGGTAGRLSYSKAYEREADYVGAYIIDHAGYDLADGRGLYRVLGGLSGVKTTSILDSHPASPDRLAGFDAAAEEIRAGRRWPRLKE